MTLPTNNINDAVVDQLVQFDEALRLGHRPTVESPQDPEARQAADFLLHLQELWPRLVRKIGRFTLVRGLGSGSVGPSYLVEDPQNGQTCVLKILWPDADSQPGVRQHLMAQARAAQSVRHVNVASVREVSEAGAVCLVLLEHCAEPSLADWRLRHRRPVSWQVALSFLAKVSDILEAAHQQGLPHGNLKPSNIFVDQDDLALAKVRITDFGLAQAVLHLRLFSRNNLAPEQLAKRSEPAGARTDIYALGVLLYELLTCRAPVPGATREDILTQTRNAMPVAPKRLCPDLPEAVDELTLACLSKNPQQRPTSTCQLAQMCREVLQPGSRPVDGNSWWGRLFGWLR